MSASSGEFFSEASAALLIPSTDAGAAPGVSGAPGAADARDTSLPNDPARGPSVSVGLRVRTPLTAAGAAAPDGDNNGDAETADEGEVFAFMFPTWTRWKFFRTLAFWVAVMYIEGSLLFIAGAAFSMTSFAKAGVPGLEAAVVATPYLVGSVCFTLGSVFGVLEILYLPKSSAPATGKAGSLGALASGRPWRCCGPANWRKVCRMVRVESIVGYLSYLVGALFFNINTVAGFLKLDDWTERGLVWIPAILGSLGFCIGRVIEMRLNKACPFQCTSPTHWLAVGNTVGAFLFLTAGVAGSLGLQDDDLEFWLVDFTYLVGSVAFLVGSHCGLWLWKDERFGLGLISELNVGARKYEPEKFVLSMQAQYGCGRSSVSQIPFLTMYLINATASAIQVGLAALVNDGGSGRGSGGSAVSDLHKILDALLSFALSHGVMLLASVVHHVPTAAPHSWLLIYCRIVLFFMCINNWLGVFHDIDLAIDMHNAGAGLTNNGTTLMQQHLLL